MQEGYQHPKLGLLSLPTGRRKSVSFINYPFSAILPPTCFTYLIHFTGTCIFWNKWIKVNSLWDLWATFAKDWTPEVDCENCPFFVKSHESCAYHLRLAFAVGSSLEGPSPYLRVPVPILFVQNWVKLKGMPLVSEENILAENPYTFGHKCVLWCECEEKHTIFVCLFGAIFVCFLSYSCKLLMRSQST